MSCSARSLAFWSFSFWSVALLCTALLAPCEAKEAKEQDQASTQQEESSDSGEEKKQPKKSHLKQAKKSTAKAASPNASELHIGSSQEAIRAIQELPLPQSASSIPNNAFTKTAPVSSPKTIPPAPTKTPRAPRVELPYLSNNEESVVVRPKPNIAPKAQFPVTPITGNQESELEEDTTPGGTLAPAPLRSFPRFPSPVQKNAARPGAPAVGVSAVEDETEDTDVAPDFSQPTLGAQPTSGGNDAAQMRVGGAIARGDILQSGAMLRLEIAARNTGTSSWLGDDEMPIRVVVRWFDHNTKRRARWEIKWLRDDIAPGETLNFQPQILVPRAGNFTIVVSLLRLNGSRFSPPSNDKAELKLPGEFARATFQTEVRAPSPLAAGLGGAEEPLNNQNQP